VKNFWPIRPKAKGFSIKNLAIQYRLKISAVSTNKISNKDLDNRNLIKLKEDSKKISGTKLSSKRTHWANRDFSEYKEAA
tara:strand:+ start:340 stop:579 length:240 start_codon:yes stop_codon:yes gene_type:complete